MIILGCLKMRKGASLCFMSVTDLRKLLWYPIRAELTLAVFDEINPINEHHQWFLCLNVTQCRAEFRQQISVIKSN